MTLVLAGADTLALTSYNKTPADLARQRSHHTLADHLQVYLQHSGGVHYLRCTGTSLERRLVWNDTSELEDKAMLDEMQAEWLVKVAEGCAHAHVGLTLRGAFGGRLSTDMLVGILGYVFGGNDGHLMSCVSMARIAKLGAVASLMTAPSASEVRAAKGAVAAREPRDTLMQVQQQPGHRHGPRLALVSHALSTWWVAKLIAVSEPAHERGCKWLHAYCRFMEQRHRLTPTRTSQE
jgi:hypothetical protein